MSNKCKYECWEICLCSDCQAKLKACKQMYDALDKCRLLFAIQEKTLTGDRKELAALHKKLCLDALGKAKKYV